MNNEIKEILDFIKDYIDRFSDSKLDCRFEYKDIKLLLDYITNLQQENEYLKLSNPEMNIEHFRIINENKRKIDNLRKQNKELQQEIKTKDEGIKAFTKDLCDTTEQLDDYKSRCEKAIEYCKSYSCWEDEDGTFHESDFCIDDILNILQNGSEDKQ